MVRVGLTHIGDSVSLLVDAFSFGVWCLCQILTGNILESLPSIASAQVMSEEDRATSYNMVYRHLSSPDYWFDISLGAGESA